jgi:hypothetical protein
MSPGRRLRAGASAALYLPEEEQPVQPERREDDQRSDPAAGDHGEHHVASDPDRQQPHCRATHDDEGKRTESCASVRKYTPTKPRSVRE